MLTKSIRLTDDEAAEFGRYVALTGEIEAAVLKRAALRGLRELRMEQAILSYLQHRDSSAAAEIAGLPRAAFLGILMDKGVTLIEEPPTLAEQLEGLAERFGDARLAEVARTLKNGG